MGNMLVVVENLYTVEINSKLLTEETQVVSQIDQPQLS